ncbi:MULTISPECIES: nucleotide exchange factor GrpE [Calothrix]|uniref:Nucleotide exchange factor GrpE n=2 Tax=Calothrix TaxID=1186 RepID=A0ABR8A7Q2_9CYAN|nr:MULTISPECIES: nucleotide exchange factor GrpE [Calothrix]MBD2196026.1 nucleotide exchange factor GrpE [Calothrix parietina FACHB-288]MBD2224484.1 nucleotide exchange factor GrpE [Calothrix anomala FACHB-343]
MSESPQNTSKFWDWIKSKILGFNSPESLSGENTGSANKNHYLITQEKRDLLISEIGTIQKENILLQQSLREQQTQTVAKTEDLFLELLEVSDALENLLEYLENNTEPNQEFLQRLPKSVGAVHRKFLSILKKRQVLPIELQDTQPDFTVCRVVDREVRNDLADQTITKVVRQGFRLQEKILRPTEVITSKPG